MNGKMSITEVISNLSWRFAKSMPTMPHWYTVRNTDDEYLNALYETLYYITGYAKLYENNQYSRAAISENQAKEKAKWYKENHDGNQS